MGRLTNMDESPTTKMSPLSHYVKSSITTFLAAFAIVMAATIGDVSLTKDALVALLFAGVRAGLKALFEYIATVLA